MEHRFLWEELRAQRGMETESPFRRPLQKSKKDGLSGPLDRIVLVGIWREVIGFKVYLEGRADSNCL